MLRLRSFACNLGAMINTLMAVLLDVVRFLMLCLRPAPTLAAENLFLRKQLAQYQERHVKPRRANNATRIALVWLSRFFDWHRALVIVEPATLIRWHRQGFRLLWRWRSKPGRPVLPKDLQALIRRMALENPIWGQERIANELLLKLGLKVSPRTVRKYMPDHCIGGPDKRGQSQRWSTFIRNHAKGIIACDFCVAVTATFHMLYVLVVIEHASRRLVHVNVTAYPTAEWTIQQFREAIPADHPYRILIHDRDAIFSTAVDQSVSRMGLHAIKTPVRTPVANAICERMIGTLRRECLDFVIPLNETHLYSILKEWVSHYNQSRPHMSLGPGIPKPIRPLPVSRQGHRHCLRSDQCVVSQPVLSGSTRITGLKRRPHDCTHNDKSMTILRNNEVVLVASGKQLPPTNQMIREHIGEEWYEYVPLGKFVVSAPAVCRGRPTFKYTRIEVSGVLERLGAGHAIEDLIADSQGRLTQKAIAEAACLAA